MSANSEIMAGLYRSNESYYQVIGVGEHTHTEEQGVVYVVLNSDLPGPRLRFRPCYGVDGWFSATETGEQRYTYVGNERSDL
jgi:hypothetical protein